MCDRWFGHLYETMATLGMLEDTLLIVTTDHGHSIGDEGYMGKRGYPSEPAVVDVSLIIRHPEGAGAGTTSDLLLQHTDITAAIPGFIATVKDTHTVTVIASSISFAGSWKATHRFSSSASATKAAARRASQARCADRPRSIPDSNQAYTSSGTTNGGRSQS